MLRRLISLCPKASVNLFCLLPNDCAVLKNLTFIKNTRYKYVYRNGVQREIIPGTRYMRPSPLECAEEFISSTLNGKDFMTDNDWEDLKSNLMERENFISEENFSSIVINVLLGLDRLELSHNFIEFLEKSGVRPNILTYLKYISLCSKYHRKVGQEHILKMLNKVIKEFDSNPVLDMKRTGYVIQGLCATDRWRESFNYLDKVIEPKPSREICNALASAAIRNGDESLAWEILTKWINTYDYIHDCVIEEFLLVALDMQKTRGIYSDHLIKKLFHFMQTHDVIISLNVAKLIEQYFLSHHMKWDVSYTKVSRQGVCENCSSNLRLLEMKNNDFDDLRESFLKHSVMKSDLYINTNRKEFQDYIEYINRHKPFHIVIDGLNAAHCFTGYQSKKNLSFRLIKLVKLLSGNSRKLLILARHHMKQWPSFYRILERAKVFFIDNISQDDPFVIHAALASGPHTFFVSSDLMRDHIARLENPRIIHLYKRWQLSHQMYIMSDSNNNFRFIEPVRHSITVQGDMENGWHIPYDDKIILDPYEELNNWLCIKKVI